MTASCRQPSARLSKWHELMQAGVDRNRRRGKRLSIFTPASSDRGVTTLYQWLRRYAGNTLPVPEQEPPAMCRRELLDRYQKYQSLEVPHSVCIWPWIVSSRPHLPRLRLDWQAVVQSFSCRLHLAVLCRQKAAVTIMSYAVIDRLGVHRAGSMRTQSSARPAWGLTRQQSWCRSWQAQVHWSCWRPVQLPLRSMAWYGLQQRHQALLLQSVDWPQ